MYKLTIYIYGCSSFAEIGSTMSLQLYAGTYIELIAIIGAASQVNVPRPNSQIRQSATQPTCQFDELAKPKHSTYARRSSQAAVVEPIRSRRHLRREDRREPTRRGLLKWGMFEKNPTAPNSHQYLCCADAVKKQIETSETPPVERDFGKFHLDQ